MEGEDNWSASVEDLVDQGDVDAAISLLESLISKFESQHPSDHSDLRLSFALADLAKLYASKGLSTKSDELRSRSFLIKCRAQENRSEGIKDLEIVKKKDSEETRVSASEEASVSVSADDDWEVVADRASNEVVSLQDDAGISKLSLENTEFQTPKRRGRGSFLYKTNGLYSDQQLDVTPIDSSEDEEHCQYKMEATEIKNSRFGTNHVLVLADFPPTTRTTELEKLFENFKDRGVVIRWVSDTVALAVFRTSSIAHEALSTICFPFVARILDEDDSLLSSLPLKDLEPPYPRPKTSTRTAERLIAQGVGRKLSTKFGSSELRKQEEARKNRIHERQTKRDDAWGSDDL